MLKNVVLPAPFGPMRATIDPTGIVKSTSSTATSPPNSLRSAIVSRRSSVTALLRRVPHVHERLVVDARLELQLPSPLGNKAAGTEQHDEHDDDSVDPEIDQWCVDTAGTDHLRRVGRIRV